MTASDLDRLAACAARLEAALREIVGIGMRPTFDTAAESERITAIARAALKRPKGAGDA